MLDKSIKYSTILLLPLGLLICFFGKEIILLLYGKEYIYALLPAYILLAARVIRGSMIVPIGGSLSAAGKPNLVLRFTLISAIADILLNILLIPKYGIIGAAIATTSSLLLDTGLSLFFTIKIIRFKFDYKWYSSIFGLMALSLTVFLVLKGFINIYIIGSFILVAFVSLIYKFYIPLEDKKHLINLLIDTVKMKR
jgi:O-antigen/teichoic acid export membrane protein